MRVEGIIINKTAYKERDIICNVLLRSGKKVPLYVYGGQGGGRQQKGSVLEIGFMLSFELSPRKKKIDSDIYVVKEYKVIWYSQKIRDNFKAFYLMNFFIEYSTKIAIDEDLNMRELNEHAGLFNVLSNSLYFLDKSLDDNNFDKNRHLFLFLTKLSLQLGINPDTNKCVFCAVEFKKQEMCLFEYQEGGFVCHECNSQRDELLSDNKYLLEEFQSSKVLREKLTQCYKLQFKNFVEIKDIKLGQIFGIFQYINYQFGIEKGSIRTWEMVAV